MGAFLTLKLSALFLEIPRCKSALSVYFEEYSQEGLHLGGTFCLSYTSAKYIASVHFI